MSFATPDGYLKEARALPVAGASARPRIRLVEDAREVPVLGGVRSPLPLDSLSPLRYPGSKRKLLPALRQIIEANHDSPLDLFVEPFCGGASVSLGLLELGVIKHALIADFDPLIAAFWMEATARPEQLVRAMYRQPPTLANWDKWRAAQPRKTSQRALKCLFLNRTTFSGIIGGTAGPIGGRAQTSEYTIDCRFNKEQLAKRIRRIGELAADGRLLTPSEGTWQDTLRLVDGWAADLGAKSVVIYLDPPYVEKAHHLYDRPFSRTDHENLAASLLNEQRHWILSYDKVPLVLGLYGHFADIHEYSVLHHYTVKGQRDGSVPGREVIFTNLPTVPADSSSPEPARKDATR
ncbi:MAG: DNA adenine methylase [Propionibacteriaceae bacterium]|nr:DNA adenine methylase [Propionibacteriaceae bacterium]